MNVFELTMAQNGYTPKTTFWDDFTIADHFGTAAVQDTYVRAFNEWKSNIEYLTELVMVLNHKIWYYHEHNDTLCRLYDRLWKEADVWCMENLKGDDMDYYLQITD